MKQDTAQKGNWFYGLPVKTLVFILMIGTVFSAVMWLMAAFAMEEIGFYDMTREAAGQWIEAYIADPEFKRLVSELYVMRYRGFAFLVAGVITFVAGNVYLLRVVGYHVGEELPRRSFFDRIPVEIPAGLALLAAGFELSVISDCLNSLYRDVYVLYAVVISAAVALIYLELMVVLVHITVNIRTGTLVKSSITYFVIRLALRFLRWIGRGIRSLVSLYSNLRLIPKTIAGVCIWLMFELFLFLFFSMIWWNSTDIFVGVFLIGHVLLIPVLFAFMILLRRLQMAGERIAEGDLTGKVDTRWMCGNLLRFAETLNHISSGLDGALQERMKSERFKTELITNVSHDIKTPLTSIINYVDLIKKEGVTEEPLAGYIDVLDRQSVRLKKLTEDLVEASKAASGVLPVTLEASDVGVILGQAIGEYQEKLDAAGLVPVIKQSEEGVKVLADGRHLWRVFDNLLGNICKYALPGTRVYLDVEREKSGEGNPFGSLSLPGQKNPGADVLRDTVVISFKNISKEQLNISGDELMERFVRGDASRHTEGSGLGLSIANSLVGLMGGTFAITVDGDLFKAEIRLPAIMQTAGSAH